MTLREDISCGTCVESGDSVGCDMRLRISPRCTWQLDYADRAIAIFRKKIEELGNPYISGTFAHDKYEECRQAMLELVKTGGN